MITSKFDPQPFFGHTEHVALHVAAEEIFAFLNRSLRLPSVWAALVKRTTGDHTVVPAGGIVEGTEAVDVLFVRTTPVELCLKEEDLITRDKLHGVGEVRLSVSVIPERNELLCFSRTILGSHRVAKADTLSRSLQPALRTSLMKFTEERDAQALVSAGATEAVSAVLRETLQAPCFEAGLMLHGHPVVHFSSTALRQVQQAEETSVRRRAEHAASRQVEEALRQAQSQHLDHLTGLLARLTDMVKNSPEVDLPQLIRTFSEKQRAQLYEALFAGEKPVTQTRWIVAAAAGELLFFEPAQPSTPMRRLTIQGAAGPIRSVQTMLGADGGMALLLGAARGVYHLPLDRTDPDMTYLVKGAPDLRGGFNAVAMQDGRLFASHSELGIHEWRMEEPAQGRQRFASLTHGAGAIRNVEFFDGDGYCSIDDRVIRWPGGEQSDQPSQVYTGSVATITALCPSREGLFAGNSEGEILHWPEGASAPERMHHGSKRAAESLCLLNTQGVRRLVFSDTSPQIHVQVLGDSFTCRYEAGGQTLRRVEAAPDMLVATNDLRDRLIIWSPGQPAKPKSLISVAALSGHTVQDFCLVPRA